MTPEFCATMQARLEELTAGEKFHRRRDGAMVTPQVARTQLPGKAADYQEGDDYPLVRWAIWQGRLEARLAEFTVIVNLAVWTPGTVADGSDDIMRLLNAILPVANDRGLAGHRLLPEVEFHVGEQQVEHAEGMQPHPIYQAQIKLKFSAPIRRNHCN